MHAPRELRPIDPAPALPLALLALAAIAGGCPPGTGERDLETTPPLTTENPDAEGDLRAADRAAEEGDAPTAERLYRSFLTEHPEDRLVVLAELGLGRVLLADGDAEAALPHFERAAASEDTVVAERASFHRGVALHLLGRHREALDLLVPMRGQLVDPQEAPLLLRTIAAAAIQLEEPVLALDALDALVRALPPEAVADVRARIVEIASSLTPEQLVGATRELDRSGAAWPEVALRALRSAESSGDIAGVRALAAELREQNQELPEDLAAAVARIERNATADPRVIGAILPLTGRGREVGQRALRGLMLAAGSPGEGPPSPDGWQLVFRDDHGDPATAARAVEELVSSHRAIAIVGPLESAAAAAAAQRAQQLGVPLITLAPSDEVTRAGAMVFRLFPSLEGEIRDLVRAARAQGASRFATLHPASSYGEAARAALARVVATEGAQVVGSASYAPGATSFGPSVEALAATGADAVLVPDSGRQLALIGPALAAGGLWSAAPGATVARGRAIRVLVPSAGFDARLLRTAGRYLQGALFSVPFFAPTSDGEGRRFTDAFMARFSTEPDAFAAYAYDAFSIVGRAVTAGANTRESLARALGEGPTSDTAGASGGIDPTRAARRSTRLLQLSGDLFAPVP